MGRRYLVTGGAGFIGSNFVRRVLALEPEATVTNLDLLTYAGVEATVRELDADPRHTFVRGDSECLLTNAANVRHTCLIAKRFQHGRKPGTDDTIQLSRLI